MSVREGLQFEGALESDCDSLGDSWRPCAAWAPICTVCGNYARRAAAALNEIAGAAQVGVERGGMRQFPLRPNGRRVRDVGLDPFYVANEGGCSGHGRGEAADAVLQIMNIPGRPGPAIIGRIKGDHAGCVELKGGLGGSRIWTALGGTNARIC